MPRLASSSSAQLRHAYPLTERIGDSGAPIGERPLVANLERKSALFGSLEARHVPSLLASTNQRDFAEQQPVRRDARFGVGLARADADGVAGQELARFSLTLHDPGLDQKIDRR